jgi:hypothetical protein
MSLILPTPVRTPHDALLNVIRDVRRRWRLKNLLWGVAITLGVAIPVLLLTTWGMDQFRFTATAVWIFRVLAYGLVGFAAVRYLVLPSLRRVTDEQVALYLEEHAPELDGAVVSAVEFGRQVEIADTPLIRRLIERAVERCAAVGNGHAIERPELVRSSGVLAGATVLGLVLAILHPAFLTHGASYLFRPWGSREAPYGIEVTPGNVTIARGADLKVSASLRNFDAADVELAMHRSASGEWQRLPMLPDPESGGFVALVFDVDSDAEYFVQASGVQSALYRVAVADLPYVDEIALEYRFPAYTGIAPRVEEDRGDVAALAGTRVRVTVTPTIPVGAGALVVNDKDTVAMIAGADGRWSADLVVREAGFYRVALQASTGALVTASPDYLIDVLEDQPPFIAITAPGRDISVTSIDEVFAEVTAEDDFELASLELVYSVNGGQERTVALYGGSANRKEIIAGHTFYLEEFDLAPGDVVAYYARAADRRQVGGGQQEATDIYFVQIRPFDQIYRQADAGGMGGMGGDADVGALSRRQREIVAATFKLVRDSTDYPAGEYRDHLGTVTLSQGRLREEVLTLAERIDARGMAQMDSAFAVVGEALRAAVDAMLQAEERLGRRAPTDALPPEQVALQQLQRAEAVFRERQVTRGGQQAGGGGGGAANAEDLADLFELELDRQRNQYEHVQRDRRQQVDERLQETEEALRELARRQQQENERARARAQQGGDPTGGGARGQRRLAEETEELSRRLERLARDESRPELRETARRLQEAADAMRRAAANGTEAGEAVDRLRDARRLLEQSRSANLRRDAEDALRHVERLVEQQRQMSGEVGRLPDEPRARAERLRGLVDRKDQMAGEVAGMESELEQLAREATREQPEAARGLRAAAGEIRNDRLVDKIRYSRGVIQGRSTEYAQNFEEQIQGDLEELRDRIRDAVGEIGESRGQRLERSLDRARDLANALESLGERAEEQAGRRGQEEPEGQQGEQGQQGQQGGQMGQGGRDAGRQLRRELSQRVNELEQLRGQFRREGIDTRDLDRTIGALSRLDNMGAIGTPQGLAQLQSEIVQSLKEFEFAVRRQLGLGERTELRLTDADEVPAEYRRLVEEYYRALAGERRP